jgi:hypothetical protein
MVLRNKPLPLKELFCRHMKCGRSVVECPPLEERLERSRFTDIEVRLRSAAFSFAPDQSTKDPCEIARVAWLDVEDPAELAEDGFPVARRIKLPNR